MAYQGFATGDVSNDAFAVSFQIDYYNYKITEMVLYLPSILGTSFHQRRSPNCSCPKLRQKYGTLR